MKVISLFLFFVFLPLSANAHPHAWIDMQTTFHGDGKSINKISMSWRYDPIISAYNLDGLDTSPPHIDKTLQSLADNVIKNLLNEHYYTYFYQGETPIRYLEAERANYRYDKKRLILSFDLELAQPVPISSKNLTLKIYEPTYYVDMSWENTSSIQFSDQLKSHCQASIDKANPSPKQMMYAASLPPDVVPDIPLGQLFAQTIHLNCQ